MSAYVGDFRTGKTIRKMWNTNAIAGESITRATDGTISVYKDGGTTQSTTGVTDTENFDGLTGVHLVAVDTSADGTFYSAGSDFEVVLSAATIDGKTINATLFSFSLENRSALMPTTAGRTLDVSAGGEAGIDWANVGSPTTTVGLSGTTVKTATDVETDTADIQSRLPAALGANGNIKADVRDYNGTAGTFASGRPEVNTTHAAGTAWGSGAITAASIADGAIDAATFAASALDGVWSVSARTLTAGTNIQLPSNGLANVTAWTVALTGNITGNLSGSVGSVTGLTASNLDATISSRASQTSVDTIDDFLDTEVLAIKAKTDTIPASPAAAGDAMTLTSAYDFAKGTVAVTESYNADGSAPTPVQALMMIMQMLTEKSVASTTLTVKKLDGSTSAATFTLDDDTAPTSITRAT